MARKKTKKEKIRSAQRRGGNIPNENQALYSIDEGLLKEEKGSKQKVVKKEAGVKMSRLFDFDPKLLVSDIRKTMILSVLMFSLEIGLYFYLR